jgi:hypothetical protein
MSSSMPSGIDDVICQRVQSQAATAPGPERRVDAHFWLAPGIEVSCTYTLPVPPPRTYEILVCSWDVLGARQRRPEAVIPEIAATFRLTDYARGSEVAHYELSDRPRKGFHWFARNGVIFEFRMLGDEDPITWYKGISVATTSAVGSTESGS